MTFSMLPATLLPAGHTVCISFGVVAGRFKMPDAQPEIKPVEPDPDNAGVGSLFERVRKDGAFM